MTLWYWELSFKFLDPIYRAEPMRYSSKFIEWKVIFFLQEILLVYFHYLLRLFLYRKVSYYKSTLYKTEEVLCYRLQKLISKNSKLTIEDQTQRRKIWRAYIQNSKAIWTGMFLYFYFKKKCTYTDLYLWRVSLLLLA